LDFGEEGDWVLNSGVDELEKSLWQEYHRAGGTLKKLRVWGRSPGNGGKVYAPPRRESKDPTIEVLVINCPLHRLPNFEGKEEGNLITGEVSLNLDTFFTFFLCSSGKGFQWG